MEAAALANLYAKVKTMAEAATKLPVKTEKSAPAASRSDNWAAPFESLRREINRLFDDFHPFDFRLPSSRSLFARDLPALRGNAWPIAPAMDLVEQANGFEITAELPGMTRRTSTSSSRTTCLRSRARRTRRRITICRSAAMVPSSGRSICLKVSIPTRSTPASPKVCLP